MERNWGSFGKMRRHVSPETNLSWRKFYLIFCCCCSAQKVKNIDLFLISFWCTISVQPREEGVALGWAYVAGNELGLLAVIALGADADPIAGFAGKLDHVGVGIRVQKLLLQSCCGFFAFECANLHAPA